MFLDPWVKNIETYKQALRGLFTAGTSIISKILVKLNETKEKVVSKQGLNSGFITGMSS